MDISQFIAHLETLEATIKREVQQTTVIAANDLASVIAARVVQRGENANGQLFSPYSSTPYYASSFKGKARRNITPLARGTKITYGKFRELQGLNATPKNFEFTGDMWRNFGVIEVSESNGVIKANIGGKTESSAKKIAILSKQEGIDIARASASEEALVRSFYQNWLKNIFT